MSKITKLLLLLTLLVITIPSIKADDEDCGLTNLATCLPLKLVEFFITIFNIPIEFLLETIQNFLTEPVNIKQFKGLWQIITYILWIITFICRVYIYYFWNRGG